MAKIMFPEVVRELMEDPGYLTPVQYRHLKKEAGGDVSAYPERIEINVDGELVSVDKRKRLVGRSTYYEERELTRRGVDVTPR